MGELPFLKMHGLGNDVVIVDARVHDVAIGHRLARALTDRHRGIGCDHLLRLDPTEGADAFMRIWNSDGNEVGACGNGTRCAARFLMDQSGANAVAIRTNAGVLACTDAGGGHVAVDMGWPRLGWQDVPLARAVDTLALDLGRPDLGPAVAHSMGNPHAVFLVPDVDALDVATIGPALENHAIFPERANIGFATVRDRAHIRLRVWERGAGLTQACGTGACAALVAAHRRGLTGRHARLTLDGGELDITWRDDDHVIMAGPAAYVFTGTIDPDPLA
ncbi:MAG: diaminopimelate epimerase [Alphaproteobacteria bacterium]|nr:diaminopimelate epimerase [Alphaproteobacteria bacterium]